MNVTLIDGYVDEPACFGVPPYVSPYVRYCAGVLYAHGYDVSYRTCDAWRGAKEEAAEGIASGDIVLVIMGLTVPGRYRGGSPLTLKELEGIASIRRKGRLILAGPVHNGYVLRGGKSARMISPEGVDFIACGDPEASLEIFCRTGEWVADARRSYARLDEIAPLGARVLEQHPSYPDLIAEMELSRGCDRVDGRCAFCTEGAGGAYEERSAEGVAREVRALDAVGVTAFRLGRAANILAWGGERTEQGMRPDARRMEELYAGIRTAAPNLRVLHTDNCNPATPANFPEESAACLAAIVRHNTEGDGLSLGIENLDPAVRSANGLKVSFEQALAAVRLINEVGGIRQRADGLPSLLPGLNFLVGLAGDSAESLKWNSKFLETLIDEGVAVRRINIRRVMVFPGTALAGAIAGNPSRIREREYRRWKEWVRNEVDPLMLGRVAPDGTIVRDVIAEERRGNVMFGRPLGSYPPLVGIVSQTMRARDKADVMISGRGGRSLTGVAYPLDINTCGRAELMSLPGIGRARAEFLLSRRPYASPEEIQAALASLDAPGARAQAARYLGLA